MSGCVVTFHTHLSAIKTKKNFEKAGIGVSLAPVPRKLSSSCGTCMFFDSDLTDKNLLDEDFEAVYAVEDDAFSLLFENSF